MQKKIQKSFFGFYIGAFDLIALNAGFTERTYLLSSVNMVRKSLKISDTSKKAFMRLIFFGSDQKISQKYCRTDLSTVSDPLTCWLSISALIQGFLGF